MAKLIPIKIEELTFDDSEMIYEDVKEAGDTEVIPSFSSVPSNMEVEKVIPKCEFLTGGAGTGKTYEIRRRIEEWRVQHPKPNSREYGLLCATTGIAAINLGEGATTINSALRYFDVPNLKENHQSGKLQQALMEVAQVAHNLIIDEISMFHAEALDLVWDALVEINQFKTIKEMGGLGIILTGDFCQLPPVPDKDESGKPKPVMFAFQAACWKYFEANIIKLEKIWRQTDVEFCKALNYARQGDGDNCSVVIRKLASVSFNETVNVDFEGTTIYSKNTEVDRHNTTRLRNLIRSGKKAYGVKSFRWGKQRGEWKNIPETLELCDGCYVMLLANDSRSSGFRYANGSTGEIVTFNPPVSNESLNKSIDQLELEMEYTEEESKEGKERDNLLDRLTPPGTFLIKLKSSEEEVSIGKLCRQVMTKHHPNEQMAKPEYMSLAEWKEEHKTEFTTVKQGRFLHRVYLNKLTIQGKFKAGETPQIYFDYEHEKWVIGEVYYYPIRIAYATTVHKSQGLTLDSVQIDIANGFFGQPSMAYVALSRVRSAEGLRIVGTPSLLANRCNVSKKVLRWL
jgi:ATP-dependent DNA helicase PIF1